MQKYKKPTFSIEDLGHNPILEDLEIPITVRKFKNRYRKVLGLFLKITQKAEDVESTKIYTTPAKRRLTNVLSLRAKELLLWLMYDIHSGEEFIWINKVRFMEEQGCKSINTYKSALSNLIYHSILAPTNVVDVYWVNPNIFFKGSRIRKFPNNIKIVK